jgi:hypothetical protein
MFFYAYAFKSFKNYFLKKILKTCFDAFPEITRFCALRLMHFQATRPYKNMFNVWSGKKCVLMHFQATRIKSLKNYFLTSGVVKMCFDAFALTLPDH